MAKSGATLVILGHHIGAAGDDLNLTDMWRAAGSDPSRTVPEWRRSNQGSAFIEFIAGNLNMGNTHVLRTERGRGGATWGHWQIGIAYAQYLSPRFHAACNNVVRAYMEGRGTGNRNLTPRDMNAFSRAGTLLLRTLGSRAAIRPITDLARQIGLDVDPSDAEALRQAEMEFGKPREAEEEAEAEDGNVVKFTS